MGRQFFLKHKIPDIENNFYQQSKQDKQYRQKIQNEINEFVINLSNHFSEEEQIVSLLALKADMQI